MTPLYALMMKSVMQRIDHLVHEFDVCQMETLVFDLNRIEKIMCLEMEDEPIIHELLEKLSLLNKKGQMQLQVYQQEIYKIQQIQNWHRKSLSQKSHRST